MNWSSVSPFVSCCLYRFASLAVLIAISAAAASAVTPNSFLILAIDLPIAFLPSLLPVFLPGTHSPQIPSDKTATSEVLVWEEAEEEAREEEEEEV